MQPPKNWAVSPELLELMAKTAVTVLRLVLAAMLAWAALHYKNGPHRGNGEAQARSKPALID